MDRTLKKTEQDLAEKEAREINRPFLRSWWVGRTMGFMIVALVFVVLAEASVISWLFPLKEIKHSLLTGYNKDTQVIKVEPIEKSAFGWSKLMEIYSKQFVVDLHTIDGQTEGFRLKKLSLMANHNVQNFLNKQLNMNDNSSIARKVSDAGITRTVQIRRITNLAPEAPNTWQVEWEAKENDAGQEGQHSNIFISTLMADTVEKILTSNDEELNPIGYTVVKYTLRMAE